MRFLSLRKASLRVKLRAATPPRGFYGKVEMQRRAEAV